MAYYIRYGLGGGFGGCGDWEECDATNEAEAEQLAYQAACEEYEGFAGMHGIASSEEIKAENPEWNPEEVEAEYNEQRESWIDYEAEWFEGGPSG